MLKVQDKTIDRYKYAIITGAVLLVYFKSLLFGFTSFDDNALITDRQDFLSHASSIIKAFKTDVFLSGSDNFYRPMQTVSYIIDTQLGGGGALMYHLSNVVLHIVMSCLLFIFFTRLGHRKDLSLLACLVFAVHPVLTQAVAWLPGRGDLLMGVFVMLSFFSFQDYMKKEETGPMLKHLFFFLLAFYSKETAIALVPICVLYLFFLDRKRLRSLNKIRLGAGWGAVALVWFLSRQAAIQHGVPFSFTTSFKSIFLNFPAVVQYAGKIIFPFNLSVMPLIIDTAVIPGVLAIAGMLALVLLSGEARRGYLLTGLAWFLLFLLPTLILPGANGKPHFYEHRLYLPMAGVLLIFMEMNPVRRIRSEIPKSLLAPGIVILFLTFITIKHSRVFGNQELFMKQAVSDAPHSSLAHRNLGIYYQAENLVDNAIPEYVRSLELNPKEKDLHNNLGCIYIGKNNYTSAETEFRKELEVNPSNDQPYYNLGIMASRQERWTEAESLWRQTVALNPRNMDAYNRLIYYYNNAGRKEDAKQWYNRMVAVQNNQAPPAAGGLPPVNHQELAQEPNRANAEQELVKRVRANPMDEQALLNLGISYYSQGKLDEAAASWRRITEINPKNLDAYNNLAIYYARQGKPGDAIAAFEKTININPEYISGYYNLALFYARNNNSAKAMEYVGELKKRHVGPEQLGAKGIKVDPALQKYFE